MATTLRRFTISITPSMDADLDAVKKERYYKSTQNDMIRDLICRGLEALKAENEAENNEHDPRLDTDPRRTYCTAQETGR